MQISVTEEKKIKAFKVGDIKGEFLGDHMALSAAGESIYISPSEAYTLSLFFAEFSEEKLQPKEKIRLSHEYVSSLS